MYSCKVHGCRHPNTHVTLGHQCGTCGGYGHGQMECGNQIKIDNLKQFHCQRVSNPCSSSLCSHKHLHTNEGHKCYKCGRFHPIQYCNIQNFVQTQQRFYDFLGNIDPVQIFGQQDNKYIIAYVGMGCEVYIRKKYGSIQCFFLHSDSHGQYSEETNDLPIRDKFIEGLTEIHFQQLPPTNEKKCPMCRTKIDETYEIKGCSDKCSVCLDKNVEIFFKSCNHAVTCKECFDKL